MKKIVNSVFLFLTFLSYNSFGQSTATVTQPCHTKKIWVVVNYNLDFNQQFNYTLTWGSYNDSYKSKKSALFNCGGVKLNNYSVGHVFTYNNKGCENNPNKELTTPKIFSQVTRQRKSRKLKQ